ncbi:MAG: hypothetical protein ACN4GR_01895 [Arenicellales bacterium]
MISSFLTAMSRKQLTKSIVLDGFVHHVWMGCFQPKVDVEENIDE